MNRFLPAAAVALLLAGGAKAADWERDRLAWRVVLTDAEVAAARRNADVLAGFVPEPTVRAAVGAAAGAVDAVNVIGGRNGIEVSGVLGVPAAVVWPAGRVTPFGRVVQLQTRVAAGGEQLSRQWGVLLARVGVAPTGSAKPAPRWGITVRDGTVSVKWPAGTLTFAPAR